MSNAKLMKPFDLNYINSSALSFDEAKEYLLKYFIVLQGGNHAMLQKNGQYKVMKKEIITDLYLNRISKELKDFYLKKNYCIRELTYELNKDVLYDDYLNLCPRMMHEYIPYKENFDEETKKKVKSNPSRGGYLAGHSKVRKARYIEQLQLLNRKYAPCHYYHRNFCHGCSWCWT